MSTLPADIRSELEAGVSQARLAQIAGVAASTLRNYEKEGLIAPQLREGKKLYGLEAHVALERIKALRAEGVALKDIAARLEPTEAKPDVLEETPPAASEPDETTTAAELMAKVEAMRAQLAAAREKLERVSASAQTRAVRRRNELALTQRELEEVERLRESNIKRALDVTKRARALDGTIRYASAKRGVIRLDLPQKPGRKR